jgi:hypothetical protein
MEKDSFLRLQYLRMLNSEEFVVEQWRSSIDRFLRDLWDRTPTSPRERFLAPIDPSLGYSPDNVEWQFPKIRKRAGALRESGSDLTRAERKQIEQAARQAEREAKRKAIAEEIARWERLQKTS